MTAFSPFTNIATSSKETRNRKLALGDMNRVKKFVESKLAMVRSLVGEFGTVVHVGRKEFLSQVHKVAAILLNETTGERV